MKKKLIEKIITASKIHHNITTSGMKLPDAPEGAPDDLFWNACGLLVSDFASNWMYEKRNDSGNRNLCGCNATKKGEERKADNSNVNHPENILSSGACKVHDLYHVYQHGRMGATLYWEKYWKESNTRGVYFRYEEYELEEMEEYELKNILEDMNAYSDAIDAMKKSFPEYLKSVYEQWEEEKKEEEREDAMGYNESLRDLLVNDNPAIVRLAKGIKKEFTK